MRRTKIVCTLGPAANTLEIVEQLALRGMDIARINFSHGTLEDKAKEIKLIRQASKKLNKPITILQDLSGPKIRVGEVENGEIALRAGDKIVLTSKAVMSSSKLLSINYSYLTKDISLNDKILLDDGKIKLKCIRKGSDGILCEVGVGGNLKSRKGVNFPNKCLHTEPLTAKDIQDAKFGLSQGVDAIALSFVRRAEDIMKLRKIAQASRNEITLIAKIENEEAVRNIEEILEASDGIMVARGDLGVEASIENVPIYQKLIIKRANDKGKPVITATQMLESMIENPIPTRAEASDIANAILDGTDAVMLSGETAVGRYPVEAVKVMARIAEKAEGLMFRKNTNTLIDIPEHGIADATAHGVCQMAQDLCVKAIITFTFSGYTARMISKYRPKTPIYAFTPDKKVARKMNFYWGVRTIVMNKVETTDAMFKYAMRTAKKTGVVQKNDFVIFTAGVPVKEKAKTNLIRVDKVN